MGLDCFCYASRGEEDERSEFGRAAVMDTSIAARITHRPPFVGRKPELSLVAEWLDGDGSHWHVLSVEGSPGIGKSSFLVQCMEMCHERKKPLVVLAASRSSSTTSVLEEFVQKLLKFDAGGSLGERVRISLGTHRSVARQLAASGGREWAREEEDLRDLPLFALLDPDSLVLAGKLIPHGILPEDYGTYLDIERILTAAVPQLLKIVGEQGRCVVLIDDYHQLPDTAQAAIGRIAVNSLGHACWILASSATPDFDLRVAVRRTALGNLSMAEVRTYLSELGIDDPRAANHLYQQTSGFPLAVSLLGRSWDANSVPAVAGTSLFEEPSSRRALMKRMSEEIESSQERHLLRALAAFRWFDRETVAELGNRDDLHSTRVDRVLAMSIVEHLSPGYRVHPLLRELICVEWRQSRSSAFMKLNQKAASHFKTRARISSGDDRTRYLVEALYHELCAYRRAGLRFFLRTFRSAERAFDMDLCQMLIHEMKNHELTDYASRWVSFCEGCLACDRSEWDRAVTMLSDLLPRCYGTDLRMEVGLRLASTFMAQGRLAQATTIYQRLLPVVKTTGGNIRVATLLRRLGSIYTRQGEFDKAVSYLERSLDLGRKTRDSALTRDALLRLGIAFRSLGEYDRCLQYLTEANQVASRLANRYQQARILYNLGKTFRSLQQWGAAREYYEQSLAIWSDLEDGYGQATSLHSLANLALCQGDLTRAEDLFQQSLSVKRRLTDEYGIAKSLCGLAFVLERKEQLPEAITLYREALERLREIGATRRAKAVSAVLAVIETQVGDFESACQHALMAGIKECDSDSQAAGFLASISEWLGNRGFLYTASKASSLAQRLRTRASGC